MPLFENIRDAEVVFQCDNPGILVPAMGNFGGADVRKGVCQGMVLTFMMSLAEILDDSDWATQMQIGRRMCVVLKPPGTDTTAPASGRFYVNAKVLQIIGHVLGQSIFARLQDSDRTNLAQIPAMYRMVGLAARCVPGQYIDAAGGRSLLVGLRSPKYHWYHVSLQRPGKGHAISFARDLEDRYLMFDPGRGLFLFSDFERLKAVLLAEFRPFQRGVCVSGEYAGYTEVCWWGIPVPD
jgi:hypothetical protein